MLSFSSNVSLKCCSIFVYLYLSAVMKSVHVRNQYRPTSSSTTCFLQTHCAFFRVWWQKEGMESFLWMSTCSPSPMPQMSTSSSCMCWTWKTASGLLRWTSARPFLTALAHTPLFTPTPVNSKPLSLFSHDLSYRFLCCEPCAMLQESFWDLC